MRRLGDACMMGVLALFPFSLSMHGYPHGIFMAFLQKGAEAILAAVLCTVFFWLLSCLNASVSSACSMISVGMVIGVMALDSVDLLSRW